jgi:Endodeoxyribonuclease RusA
MRCNKSNNVAYMSRKRWQVSVRKRSWEAGGVRREKWVVDFKDASGRRRLKTFALKKDADKFAGVATAIGSGQIPEPLTRGYRPLEFTSPLPFNGWRKGSGRETIAEALRAQCSTLKPTTDSVIVHVVAEMPPSSVIADVDNLLKPVLDALKGVAWIDDTQVCELLARRVPGRGRRLHVKIWQNRVRCWRRT